MTQTASFENPDVLKFLEEAHIRLSAAYTAEGISGARVGTLLGDRDNPRPWLIRGFNRVSDVLDALVAHHPGEWRVERGISDIRLISVKQEHHHPLSAETMRTTLPPQPRTQHWHIPEDLWIAFLRMPMHGRQSFYNRQTGEVVREVESPPDASGNWVQVRPISHEQQLQWFRVFLDENSLTQETAFAQVMTGESSGLNLLNLISVGRPDKLTDWKSFRISKIRRHVDAWRTENKIDQIVQPLIRNPIISSQYPHQVEKRDSRTIRQVAVEILSRLDDSQLMQIQIPMRVAIEVLRPELLDN